VPTESVAVAAGRDVKKYRAPGRVIATSTKIFLSALIVAAITFGLVAYRAQTERTLLAEFQEKRTAAEAGSQVDFVFSIKTGTVEVVPRQ